jgi:vacuolar-type H+-ATPase subunit E/Vma4
MTPDAGIRKVEDAVLKEAEAAAAHLTEEARRSQEQILARCRAECEESFRKALAQAHSDAERETARQLAAARHRGRLEVLAAKNEVLNAVFERAERELLSMADAEYMRMMSDWLLALPPDAGGVLRVGAKDASRFTDDFLKTLNDARTETGRFTGVSVDENIKGGFVLAGENFNMDQTVERKVGDLRESMAPELSEELFER